MKIVLDKQLYRPGSVVKGRLLLNISSPCSAKCIKLNATGTSKVKFTHSRLEEYVRSEKYLDVTFYLWKRGESLEDRLPCGAHEFPFEFRLPANIPSSFEGKYGWTQYTITVWILTSGIMKKGARTSTKICVQRIVHVLYPELQSHRHVERDVAGGLFKFSGRIKFTAELPRTGYLIGEIVPLAGHIMNTSTSNVSLCVYFVQHVQYVRGSRSAAMNHPYSIIPNVFSHRGTCQTTWACSGLRIPNTLAPSGSTHPVDVQYSIKVSMYASGTAKSASIMIPITVGNSYSHTASVHPEGDCATALNASYLSFTSLNPSLHLSTSTATSMRQPLTLPTSSTYPATSVSQPLTPSTVPTYPAASNSVNPSQCLSMPLTYPAQTSTTYQETSSVGIDCPPVSSRTTSSSFSGLSHPTSRSHITGSLPHLGVNASAWQTTSDSESEMPPPSYDELFPD